MPADASSQSSSMVAQFEIAARSRTRRATQWRPEVSSTHASAGSAMMNELLYRRASRWLALPPWP